MMKLRVGAAVLLLFIILSSALADEDASGTSAGPRAFVDEELFPGGFPASIDEIRSFLGEARSVEEEQIDPWYFEGGYVETLVYWNYPGYRFVFFKAPDEHLILADCFIDFDLPSLVSAAPGTPRESILNLLGTESYSYGEDLVYSLRRAELIFQFENGKLTNIFINYILL